MVFPVVSASKTDVVREGSLYVRVDAAVLVAVLIVYLGYKLSMSESCSESRVGVTHPG